MWTVTPGMPGCQSSVTASSGLELVPRRPVRDDADDAAVLIRLVRLLAPVDPGALADPRQEVHVDGAAELGRGVLLLLRLPRQARRLVAVHVLLEHEPLAERVRPANLVATVGVGDGDDRAVREQHVRALADRQQLVRDALLAGILAPVGVDVVVHRAVDPRPPLREAQRVEVGLLARPHGDVLRVEDVVLVEVPDGEHVVAGRDVRDVEVARGERVGLVLREERLRP